ncbi:MAG: nickel-responsive transcriptional regulator NikR [Phycisphaerae bacterium]
MPHIDRISISLDTELLAAFDQHIASMGYENRSEAIRDMIRDSLLAGRLRSSDEQVVAFLTLTCDQRVGEMGKRLRDALSAHSNLVGGSLHVPIDQHRENVVIVLRGAISSVQSLANELQALRGVAHGHLAAVPAVE